MTSSISAQPSRRVQKKRSRARARLVDATREVILRDGFTHLTVDAVAEVADVSKAAVYYYFDSKESLARELMMEESREEIEVVIAAVEATPVGDSVLAAAARAYVGHHRHRLELFRAVAVWPLTLEAPPDGYPEADRLMMQMLDVVEARLVADAEAGRLHDGVHPRRTALTTWNAMHGLVSTLTLLASVNTSLLHTVDGMVDELCGILTRGVYRDATPSGP